MCHQSVTSPEHFTPASFSWVQWELLWRTTAQRVKLASCPVHWTCRSQISPLPAPNSAPRRADSAKPHPSSRHTTSASRRSQPWSQTVLHRSWRRTSTLPEHLFSPSTSLTPPVDEEKKMYYIEKVCGCGCIKFTKSQAYRKQ